jgi:beta-mannanase
MNGNWFNWGQGFNNNTAADYLAAWKHVHAIFDEVGATNATWVWCPFVNPNGSANIADPAAFYPGDEYVDWTCLDGYNWGTNTTPKRNWHSFEFWFGSTYDRLRQIAPAKPMLVGETGSSEFGGSKAQWLSEMFAALPTRFPALRGLIYFDVIDAEHDWPIETSPEAQAAFAAGIADSRYRGSEFGSLGSNPIPAP